jgi:protein-disulfide isomerase
VNSGVTGKPTFFINGKKYNGDWEDQPFETVVKLSRQNLLK